MPFIGPKTYKKPSTSPFGYDDQDRYDRNEARTAYQLPGGAIDAFDELANTKTPPPSPLGTSPGSDLSKQLNALDKSGMRTEVSKNGDVWDGFARRYVPGQRDLLFSNPDIIVRDWLSQGKYKNNPQLAGDMSRYANIMFGDDSHGGLYELLTGGSLNPKATGDDDQINALVNLLGEQSKVGGKSPSVQQMLQLLFEGFDNPNSTMGGMLTTGAGDDASTGQAINAMMQYIPLLGEFTGNRRYADAMYRQATRLANDYQDQAVHGKNTGSFVDFMKQNYLRG